MPSYRLVLWLVVLVGTGVVGGCLTSQQPSSSSAPQEPNTLLATGVKYLSRFGGLCGLP